MRVNKQWLRQGVLVLTGVLLLGSTLAQAEEEFPLRAKHPAITPITTAELAAVYDQAIIVDSRDAMEFKVIHMKGAHNFLVAKMQEADLSGLRPKDGPAPLVFYCNGITCEKSYDASEKAAKWGFANVKVYDAGIFTWAKEQPERTLIFDQPQTAETIKTSLISKEKLAEKMLAPAEFIAKSKDTSYTIIDIRGTNERKEIPIKLPKLKVMPLDTMVKLLEEKSPAIPSKGLLIIDIVGKQVSWVQYYLEQQGATDYFFLKGGGAEWKKEGFNETGGK